METETKANTVVNHDELLTFQQAAEKLGVSKRTVQTYVKFHWIRTIAITGRTKRIRRSEFERFVQLAADDKLPPPEGWGSVRQIEMSL